MAPLVPLTAPAGVRTVARWCRYRTLRLTNVFNRIGLLPRDFRWREWRLRHRHQLGQHPTRVIRSVDGTELCSSNPGLWSPELRVKNWDVTLRAYLTASRDGRDSTNANCHARNALARDVGMDHIAERCVVRFQPRQRSRKLLSCGVDSQLLRVWVGQSCRHSRAIVSPGLPSQSVLARSHRRIDNLAVTTPIRAHRKQ